MLALEGLDVEVAYGDITERDSLQQAVRGCDAVIHTAALFTFWERDPGRYYQVNVEGTRMVLEVARDAGVDRVVYTSTVGCLAASPKGRLTREEDDARPAELVSHYTRSKYLAEREASRLCREDEVPVLIVNPTATVGPWDVKPTPIGMLVLRFLRGRMPAYIETGLNLASVEDVAQGHLLALEKGRVGERYILGGSNLRLKEFLDILGAITGRRAPWLRVPGRVWWPW